VTQQSRQLDRAQPRTYLHHEPRTRPAADRARPGAGPGL